MSKDYAPELQEARRLLTELQDHIISLDCSIIGYTAPVLDRTGGHWRQDEVLGFKRFSDTVQHQMDVLTSMVASGIPPKESPLPGVQGLITFYKLVLISRPPLAGLRVTMRGKGKGRGGEDEGFVDIIARGGKEWIRIYSKKTSHLLAEFREADSYVNSDYDSDSTSSQASSSKPKLERECQNSLIQTAQSLHSLSQTTDRMPLSQPPKLRIHLSRISPNADEDERIPLTFARIREMGVELTFGDLEDINLGELPKFTRVKDARVGKRINLDPTSLMGLCSDILHYPLPPDIDSAKKRFFRPKDALMPSRRRGKEEEDADQSQNSRELVRNLLEEMEIPLVPELRDTLAAAGCEPGVEFWATKDAVRYLREALGGEVGWDTMEQKRMRRLIGDEEGDFWKGSRYEGEEGCLAGIKVRIFEESDQQICPTGFHRSLFDITSSFLEAYDHPETNGLPAFLKTQRMPQPKVAKLSQPFPIVSLGSLRRGAGEGMTTLMMGNIVLREVFSSTLWKIKGWLQGDYDIGELQGEGDDERVAAVWMLPYRSLGESKRVKFAKEDWSYPTKS